MTQPSEEPTQPKQQIKHDGNAPRLAVFVWLEDGTCHQVSLNMKERIGLGRCLLREHDDAIKVFAPEFPMEWRKSEEE
jgi:hypothetical protein